MSGLIGDLLPLAVGVAISPVPIIAAILMLLSERARVTSWGFLLGWVLGIVTATTIFTILAAGADTGGDDGSSSAAAWVKVVLGALLLLMALKQWRDRPTPGEVAAMPTWMSAFDSFGFGKSAGLGVLLSAVNPKNLILCAAAGTAIGSAVVGGADRFVTVMVFTVLAASTVGVPVIGYAVSRQRLVDPLSTLKAWLEAHNAAVMSTLLLVIGVTLLGKGVGGL
jgi:Na+/melibiose symporter-like transporter